MSMSSIIRAVAGGPTKTRAEGGKPDEDMEYDESDKDSADDQPEDSAADDNPDEDAEGDQPDESGEDDEDTPMAQASATAFARGRKAERGRIGAIMGNEAADANPQLAAHLAFATAMSVADATAALKAAGPSRPEGGRLAGKMAGANQPRLGGNASGGGAAQSQPERIAAAAASIIEAKRAKRTR